MIWTVMMLAGGAAITYGFVAPEQTADVRALVGIGIAAFFIATLALQRILWSGRVDKSVERRQRPRHPEDKGPGVSGRRCSSTDKQY